MKYTTRGLLILFVLALFSVSYGAYDHISVKVIDYTLQTPINGVSVDLTLTDAWQDKFYYAKGSPLLSDSKGNVDFYFGLRKDPAKMNSIEYDTYKSTTPPMLTANIKLEATKAGYYKQTLDILFSALKGISADNGVPPSGKKKNGDGFGTDKNPFILTMSKTLAYKIQGPIIIQPSKLPLPK
ncbi:MAG: hypothetical protein WC624_00265 [Candidatus Margulisiibacteriota bacterium]